ncbi:MAG: type II toxin-antitoxin system PemK/MazF family toxin [Acidimicrobiia bacterium]
MRNFTLRRARTKAAGSMLTSGDVVDLNLGDPEGRKAGFRHPAVVVTAQRILDADPSVIQVVPLTSTIRGFGSEVAVEPDHSNGLLQMSAAQCQHVRAVSTGRVEQVRGNVGPAVVSQIRETIALILDIPS